MYEGQVTPEDRVVLGDPLHPRAPGPRWLVRHYHASVYDRMLAAGKAPHPAMLNRQERRRRFGNNPEFREAITHIVMMATSGGAWTSPTWMNRRKARRRAVRAAGGQA